MRSNFQRMKFGRTFWLIISLLLLGMFQKELEKHRAGLVPGKAQY